MAACVLIGCCYSLISSCENLKPLRMGRGLAPPGVLSQMNMQLERRDLHACAAAAEEGHAASADVVNRVERRSSW